MQINLSYIMAIIQGPENVQKERACK